MCGHDIYQQGLAKLLVLDTNDSSFGFSMKSVYFPPKFSPHPLTHSHSNLPEVKKNQVRYFLLCYQEDTLNFECITPASLYTSPNVAGA